MYTKDKILGHPNREDLNLNLFHQSCLVRCDGQCAKCLTSL